MRRNFKNITTIPLQNEPREYRLVFVNSDDVLVGIINKTMAAIPPSAMQSVILESMSRISPEITLSTIFDVYGVEITALFFALVLLVIVAFGRCQLKKTNVEKKVFEERAKRDSLTGLYNFAACRELISSRLEGKAADGMGAFLMMDIDKFKAINDTMGHYEGDQTIIAIAEALKDTFRKSDIKGRLGGDEFCVFMDAGSKDVVMHCCARLRTHIAKAAAERNTPVPTVSIGVAAAAKGLSFDELYKMTDSALYGVKRAGGDGLGFAHGDINSAQQQP